MENDIENEGSGITLGYIFRTIFSQKWLALILVAVITLAGTLGLYFMGKRGVTYSVSFVMQLPKSGDASSTSYTYPDGESFYYTDIISSENIKEVAKRDGFGSIDVDKMIKNNAISITRNIDKLDETSTEGVYDLNYTVKVKASYFANEDEAREFIEAITGFPREYIANMNINYDQSLTTSKSAITYEEQLDLLRNQTVYIQSKYSELISTYGSEFVVGDGRTLAQCKNEVDAYLTKDLFTSLINRAKESKFIKSGTEERLKYESDLYATRLQLQEAEGTLEGLIKIQSSAGSVIYDKITELNREIARLKIQEEILVEYMKSYDDETKIAPADFEEEIANVEASVAKFTEDINPVASYVYGKVTKVNYLSTKVVEVEGGRGIAKSLIISLVAGLVAAAVIAYIVGWYVDKKKSNAVTVKAEVPAMGEAQLQAAATDATETDSEDTKTDK